MFAKVFTSLWQGSLVGKADEQLVFIFLLANADERGEVDYFPPVIASLTGMGIDRVKAALLQLEAPDEFSRSSEMEGRRLVRLDEHREWGWRIVNYAKYRAIRNAETRREQNRISSAKYRQRSSAAASDRHHAPAESAQAEVEAEAEAEADAKKKHTRRTPSAANKDWVAAFAEQVWPEYPKNGGRYIPALKAWIKITDRSQESFQRITSAIDEYVAGCKSEGKEPRFILHLSSFLNQRAWETGPASPLLAERSATGPESLGL